MKFCNEFITVYNDAQESNFSVRRGALEKYDFKSLEKNLPGKDRLLIPPNFLAPQLVFATKLKDSLELYIGNQCNLDDSILVSLRIASESIVFVSHFRAVMDMEDAEVKTNPFDLQRLISMHL